MLYKTSSARVVFLHITNGVLCRHSNAMSVIHDSHVYLIAGGLNFKIGNRKILADVLCAGNLKYL